jgi:nucleoside-diphosphate-sugar epimerase
MSKTLVVGGNGYIGKHLQKKFPEFIYIGKKEFDLNNFSKIKKFLSNLKIDRCIILSAVIRYEKIVNFKIEPLKTNLLGLNNLLSLLDDKVKVIYFSSMTVYDEKAISPVKEDSNLLPLHVYGLSKVYAEQLVKFYNFKSIIIRIPGIYGGDRKSGLIYNTIKNMKKNFDVEIDTSNIGYWETMHIDDMLDMFSKLLKNYKYKTKYEIYNISYGEPTDILDTVYFIKTILGSKSNIKINKNYKDFYLSNNKIVSFIGSPLMTFKERLKLYVNEVDN